MNESRLTDKKHKEKHKNTHLPALTGLRFFAIFHIFLHHLWALYNYHSGKTEATQDLLIGLKDFPETLLVIMSNGWVSTSLFFILSGFILAYIYWGEDGQFTISNRRFWLLRFARLYPVHLLVLLILIVFKFPTYPISPEALAVFIIAGATPCLHPMTLETVRDGDPLRMKHPMGPITMSSRFSETRASYSSQISTEFTK
jgi:peptidoglycan/LPS O-acetylase OafA/YrhL